MKRRLGRVKFVKERVEEWMNKGLNELKSKIEEEKMRV